MAQYVFTMNAWARSSAKRRSSRHLAVVLPGAKIGVLGINGSGKSSLLRIMAASTRDRRRGDPMPAQDRFLQQEPKLDPQATVREAVEEA